MPDSSLPDAAGAGIVDGVHQLQPEALFGGLPMRCTLAGLLALLLLLSALRAEDDKDQPKNKPSTPAAEYQALAKEYELAQEKFDKALQEAKTINARQKVLKEKRPKPEQLVGKFLALAKQSPKDPVAFDALSWIVRFGGVRPKEVGEATQLLLRDHVTNPQMAPVCQSLANSNSPAADKLLRAVLDKNPDHEAQGTACYVLAARLLRQATTGGRVKPSAPAKKLYQEATQLLDRVARDYTDVDWVRTAVLAPNSLASADLIKAATEKKTDQDDKGKGIYVRAQGLKRDAEQAAQNGKSADADKLNLQAEQLLEQLAKEYAGAEFQGRKFADVAKAELFEIRHLTIGKQAPEIDAEDLDGKKLKLSDFRGKVVLLDFWGNW
jgi:hypothetical protein